MKPKTKLQKRVALLSKKLPPLTEAQINWAKENIYKPTGYLRTKSVWCLECGENFGIENGMHSSILGEECPRCGKELKIIKSRKRSFQESNYYTIFTRSKEYQVLRHFIVKKICKSGSPCEIEIKECVQNWITPEGEVLNIARATVPMGYYYDSWIYSSPMEIRSLRSYHNRYDIYAKYIYPYKQIIPELKRNGFNGGLHDISPYRLLPGLLTQTKLETLIKAKQYKLLNFFCSDYSITKIDEYWPAIKICIRNNYIVKDASNWCDYIDLLLHFGKDIRNSHFVCPDNLHKAHDRYIEKRRIERDRLAIEEKRKRAIENEAAYREFISRFLELSISDEELVIEPLKSVAEFIAEGDELHHCVFANNYFDRDNCLILSAKINGQRVETIQFDLNELQVVQSRGAFNKNTTYHKRIVELVNKNKHVIHDLKHVKLDKAV